MNERLYVVIVNTTGDDPEIVQTGSEDKCKAYLFDICRPGAYVRNIKPLDTENGYSFEVEQLKQGEWVKQTFHIRSLK